MKPNIIILCHLLSIKSFFFKYQIVWFVSPQIGRDHLSIEWFQKFMIRFINTQTIWFFSPNLEDQPMSGLFANLWYKNNIVLNAIYQNLFKILMRNVKLINLSVPYMCMCRVSSILELFICPKLFYIDFINSWNYYIN